MTQGTPLYISTLDDLTAAVEDHLAAMGADVTDLRDVVSRLRDRRYEDYTEETLGELVERVVEVAS